MSPTPSGRWSPWHGNAGSVAATVAHRSTRAWRVGTASGPACDRCYCGTRAVLAADAAKTDRGFGVLHNASFALAAVSVAALVWLFWGGRNLPLQWIGAAAGMTFAGQSLIKRHGRTAAQMIGAAGLATCAPAATTRAHSTARHHRVGAPGSKFSVRRRPDPFCAGADARGASHDAERKAHDKHEPQYHGTSTVRVPVIHLPFWRVIRPGGQDRTESKNTSISSPLIHTIGIQCFSGVKSSAYSM
jgi:hypothetical protein